MSAVADLFSKSAVYRIEHRSISRFKGNRVSKRGFKEQDSMHAAEQMRTKMGRKPRLFRNTAD